MPSGLYFADNLPCEGGNILERIDNVDPLISKPPDEKIAYKTRHHLEDESVLDTGAQGFH